MEALSGCRVYGNCSQALLKQKKLKVYDEKNTRNEKIQDVEHLEIGKDGNHLKNLYRNKKERLEK